MVDENIIVPSGTEGGKEKVSKKRAPRKTKKAEAKSEKSLAAVTGEPKSKSVKNEEGSRKRENHVFGLIITAVVILGISAIGFGYVRDKIINIETGGTEPTKSLQAQVEALQNELSGLKEKATELEQETDSNKSAVIDIFDKSREIPKTVNVTDWNQFNDPEYKFLFSYPKNWEVVKPNLSLKEGEVRPEIIYLQPTGAASFLNAVTIKNDYADFAKLSLADKKKIFIDMNVIDKRDFEDAALIYFISAEKDSREVPTIVFLSVDAIYKLTFNVLDKKEAGYFDYRKDFEKIAATFTLRKPTAQ